MGYSRYRRLRTPIVSGVTEAACKIVFTQRFKRAGMKWNIDDGQPILDVRVIALSGRWLPVLTAMLESKNCTHLQNGKPVDRKIPPKCCLKRRAQWIAPIYDSPRHRLGNLIM